MGLRCAHETQSLIKRDPFIIITWRRQPLSYLQNEGGAGAMLLPLAVTSSFSSPPGVRVTPFSSEIDEQLTSVGPHYPGNEANAWKRQPFPMARALTNSTLCWAVLGARIILHFDLNLFVFVFLKSSVLLVLLPSYQGWEVRKLDSLSSHRPGASHQMYRIHPHWDLSRTNLQWFLTHEVIKKNHLMEKVKTDPQTCSGTDELELIGTAQSCPTFIAIV